jgi:hypothetical protein
LGDETGHGLGRFPAPPWPAPMRTSRPVDARRLRRPEPWQASPPRTPPHRPRL